MNRETPEATPRPWTNKDRRKIATLDRRARFLEARDGGDYDDSESAAIRWALKTLDRLQEVEAAARRYQSAEWAIRLHEDDPVATPEHNARVEEWRDADRTLRAALGDSRPTNGADR